MAESGKAVLPGYASQSSGNACHFHMASRHNGGIELSETCDKARRLPLRSLIPVPALLWSIVFANTIDKQ